MTTSQKQFSSECLQLSEPSVRKCPTKFIGKHLYQSLFLIKTLAFIYSAIWLKKRVRPAQVFSCEWFCEVFNDTYFKEQLCVTPSGFSPPKLLHFTC